MAASLQQTHLRAGAKPAAPGRRTAVCVTCKSLFGGFGSKAQTTFNKYEIRRLSTLTAPPTPGSSPQVAQKLYADRTGKVVFQGVHHVALLCENLERSMQFYTELLGLTVNPDRPHSKLPYRGAWLWIGPEMIHLMELPNPDPLAGRPQHGGRDRHFCVGVESVEPLVQKLEAAGIPYTKSMSGRPAVFFRDPDMNCLECVELEAWR